MAQKMLLKDFEEMEGVKIGVISDTHDNIMTINRAVEFFNEEEVDLVLHAGDVVSPFTADVFKELKCDMILIYGNNDGDKLYLKEKFKNIGIFYNDPYIGELYGRKIAMTHKPEIVKALAMKYDIVIYGHTHEVDIKEDEALIINPGECCGYLTGKRSVAVLYPKELKAKVIEL